MAKLAVLSSTALSFLVAGALLSASAGAARARVGSRVAPRPVLVVPGGLDGFAMDGDRFVYSGGGAAEGCATVELRSFSGQGQERLGTEVAGAPKADACDLAPLFLALAGTRAVWGGFEDCCMGGYGQVETGAPGTQPAELESLGQDYHDTNGDFLTGVAGDGQTLVYATTTVEIIRNQDGCFPPAEPPPGPQTCDFKVTKWAVKRVLGAESVAVPNAPPAALIAVSGNRLAIVPADQRTATCAGPDPPSCRGEEPTPIDNGAVEIRDATSGDVIARFSPKGTVTAVALSGRIAAVLVRAAREGSTRIERYDSTTGALRGRTTIPAGAADQLSINGGRIVYHIKKAIRLLNAQTGIDSLLALAKAEPLGLSIEGRRVAWAENIANRGRVMSLLLPP